MNPATLTQLKILVERAVRPIEAGNSRKQQMREELLAHVTAVFEEEEARRSKESLALQRTQERFGDPADLTGQLQASVPTIERWAQTVDDVFAGVGLTALELALLYALFALLPAACLLICFYLQGRMAEWPFAAAFPVVAFMGAFLVAQMRAALSGPEGRSWGKAVLVGTLSSLLIPGVTFALCLTYSGDWRASLIDVLPILPGALLLTPTALILPVIALAVDGRTDQEWESLQID